MPKNILYKYKCKELLCNQLIRSDKWNEHCQKKHKVKYLRGDEIKKEITAIRRALGSPWEDYTDRAARSDSTVGEQ